MTESKDLAADKLEYLEQLFRNGERPADAIKAVEAKYGSSITRSRVYQLFHKFHGTEPKNYAGYRLRGARKKKKKAAKKKTTKKKAVKMNRFAASTPPALPDGIVEFPITIEEAGPCSPGVESLLRVIVDAMRKEQVKRITLSDDGRAKIEHTMVREVDCMGE